MKKTVGILLATVLVTSLAGCSKMNEISHAMAVGVNQADQATSEDTREEIAEERSNEKDVAAEDEDAKNSGKEDKLFGSLLDGAGKMNTANNREKIDEAIANNMLFTCCDSGGDYALDEWNTLYVVGNVLYASGDARSSLSTYAELVSEGSADAQILEVLISRYDDRGIFLDANGKVWYRGDEMFSGYTVKYFDDWYRYNGGKYKHIIAAVTEDGHIVYAGENWFDFKDGVDAVELEGAENVKYVTIFDGNIIAFVREDGTAAYASVRTGKITELTDWSDIASLNVVGSTLIGLRYDSTLTAVPISKEDYKQLSQDNLPYYLKEITSWSDIVYLITDKDSEASEENYVIGMKADGSFVYVAADSSEAAVCEQTFATWNNVKVVASESGYISAGINPEEDGNLGMGGAIDADNNLYGSARAIIFAWNLEKPWESIEAAQLDYKRSEKRQSNTKYNDTLPAVQ